MMNPQNVYMNTSIQTASPERLLIMLFDGALRFSKEAISAIEQKNFPRVHEKIRRTQDIVNELIITLDRDRGGEVAENLLRLYGYIDRKLIEANVSKSVECLLEVISLLQELREGFHEAVKQLKK
ncbi:flagellar export chaperone FliS [Effusibacillus dendaii]|uniref:Flagellar protein FliS n=1 Tax=Effusibacillus dendaii TaxID=2743772 RepID=A0A7I8DG76_9BACL|nr:flagellar export chaperone FliS [Effusibacillus dendaii]BCJ87876.1 flagellar protein FliS [Effusibacillus dendaii]